MRRPETLQDLIEEAKVRTVCWAICAFAIAYFLSHTSKSMWTNMPMSILILSAFRYLSYEVELRWRVRPVHRQTYLSHLEKKQLSVNDSRLSTLPNTSRWKRKINSPSVEAAIDDFINKILQDFVVDLWYSSITPDKEAPELIRVLIRDALGEIAGRIKETNLVDLLTRDMVDLVGNHLDLYRRNQSAIGADVMGTLSFEERDERLKCLLITSEELHPALLSSESEHKVLQRIVGGILAIVLRRQEAQCPLVRCISRELLTCLVVQPVMNFACPGYINELIEYAFLASENNNSGEVCFDRSGNVVTHGDNYSVRVENKKAGECDSRINTSNKPNEQTLACSARKVLSDSSELVHPNSLQEDLGHDVQIRAADWAMILDATTKRRTQILAPENLENMWTKGRNYKKKSVNIIKAGASSGSTMTTSGTIASTVHSGKTGKELLKNVNETITGMEDDGKLHLMHVANINSQSVVAPPDSVREEPVGRGHFGDGGEEISKKLAIANNNKIKRSNSTPDIDTSIRDKCGESTSSGEYFKANAKKQNQDQRAELVSHNEGPLHSPKIKCRVVGAYFEKIGSKSFAVYSVAVKDAENKWFVKRRYRNFERLHRHLKDIPNYSLQLPPKRFLSSSIDDYFVHQRCILLDKYLQDLLSIANVAEQHEVWDFLSLSSKNYSFGKSTSVMKTLAVNVDDAMDDIVRQFKGVSDGLRRKVVGSSPSDLISHPIADRTIPLPWIEEETSKYSPSYSNMGTSCSLSDEEAHDEDHSSGHTNGWHSENELNSKSFPPRVVKRIEESASLDSQKSRQSDKFDKLGFDKLCASKNAEAATNLLGDLATVPPEWTPPNVSVPLLNLVDKLFQLNRRGWLRRQVFWISKQILQLLMEDAIDDWILRQIHWLRKDEVIAQGIRWVQDVLWPNGTFFIKLDSSRGSNVCYNQKPSSSTNRQSSGNVLSPSSFDLQLEAARRASDVKKMILGGAPTALVSLIGHSQYRRSAKDVYYFLQSSVCVKQLTYGMLELLIVSVFPELHHLILDIHGKPQPQG